MCRVATFLGLPTECRLVLTLRRLQSTWPRNALRGQAQPRESPKSGSSKSGINANSLAVHSEKTSRAEAPAVVRRRSPRRPTKNPARTHTIICRVTRARNSNRVGTSRGFVFQGTNVAAVPRASCWDLCHLPPRWRRYRTASILLAPPSPAGCASTSLSVLSLSKEKPAVRERGQGCAHTQFQFFSPAFSGFRITYWTARSSSRSFLTSRS